MNKPKRKVKGKRCTKCKSTIHHQSTKCPHCGHKTGFEAGCYTVAKGFFGMGCLCMLFAMAVPFILIAIAILFIIGG